MSKRKKWALWLAALVLAGAGGAALWNARTVQAVGTLPTADARKGDFQVIVRCRGELKARRSVQVSAPVNVPELRIVWLAPAGSAVIESLAQKGGNSSFSARAEQSSSHGHLRFQCCFTR